MPVVIQVESVDEKGERKTYLTKMFSQEKVTIGRSPDNDLVLPEHNVSGKHAILMVRAGSDGGQSKFFITDIGSSNGTFIEEQRLTPHQEISVSLKDRIIVGRFILRVASPDEKVDAGKVRETPIKGKKDALPEGLNANGKSSPVSSAQSRQELYAQEIKFKQLVHEQLLKRLDLKRKDILQLSEGDVRMRAQEVVERIITELRWEIPAGLNRDRVIKEILDEALSLGPLEELLMDDSVSEIMVNSYNMIYAERKGMLALSDYRFSSEQAVLAAIERIIAPIGRRIDESSPMVDARLKDGSRVNAVIRPLALRGPCITIRKFGKKKITAEDLVGFGSMSKGMAEFLRLAVENRLNVVISGGTGSGKTTLLNVISSFIPTHERLITVEDAAELQLAQEHLVAFETRPPNLEGKGAITIRDLVKNALRMRPDRIIVGECRGAEALDMLQAMNTGHDGSMTTGHANTPQDMIARLETMVLMAGMDLPVRAVREQIASAVHMVVQQTRFSCGTRKVTAVTEIVGMDYDEGKVMMQDVFLFRQDGYGADGKISGHHQATGYVPHFFRKLQQRGLPVNAEVFSPEQK